MPSMTKEQLDHFNHYGFVAIENVLDPANVIDPIIDEYAGVLNNLADKLYAESKITSKYEDLEFSDRVTQIYAESGEVHNKYFDFTLSVANVTHDTPFWVGPAVFNALTAPGLLDAVESLIGSEIYSNPVQHVRIKVPERDAPRDDEGNVIYGAAPWHQDCGVVNPEADETDLITVWFPLMDTDEENGCLQVVPGSHRGEDMLTHCPGGKAVQGNLLIPESEFEAGKAVAVPLKKGRRAFLHQVHGALVISEQQRPQLGGVSICDTTPSVSRRAASFFRASWPEVGAIRSRSCAIRWCGARCGKKPAPRSPRTSIPSSIVGTVAKRSARRGGSRTFATLRTPFVLRTFPPRAGETLRLSTSSRSY